MSILKDLLKRLRKFFFGYEEKPSRKKLLSKNRQKFETSAPKKIYEPPIEVAEKIPEKSPIDNFSDKFIIDIKDGADLKIFLDKLNDLRDFEKFLFEMPWQWVNVRLGRVRNILKKISPNQNFDDDELNSKLANNVRAVAQNMLDIFQNSTSSRDLNEDSRKNLKSLVENYLEKIGVDKIIFKQGDSFDDWAKLNMPLSFLIIETDNSDLAAKIANIEIQPHVIYYRGDTGDVDKINFGGLCKVYKFKPKGVS